MPSLALNEAMRGQPWLPRFPMTHHTVSSRPHLVPEKRGHGYSPLFRVGREHRESMARSRVDATHGQRRDHHSGPTACTGAEIPCFLEREIHILRSLKSKTMHAS